MIPSGVADEFIHSYDEGGSEIQTLLRTYDYEWKFGLFFENESALIKEVKHKGRKVDASNFVWSFKFSPEPYTLHIEKEGESYKYAFNTFTCIDDTIEPENNKANIMRDYQHFLSRFSNEASKAGLFPSMQGLDRALDSLVEKYLAKCGIRLSGPSANPDVITKVDSGIEVRMKLNSLGDNWSFDAEFPIQQSYRLFCSFIEKRMPTARPSVDKRVAHYEFEVPDDHPPQPHPQLWVVDGENQRKLRFSSRILATEKAIIQEGTMDKDTRWMVKRAANEYAYLLSRITYFGFPKFPNPHTLHDGFTELVESYARLKTGGADLLSQPTYEDLALLKLEETLAMVGDANRTHELEENAKQLLGFFNNLGRGDFESNPESIDVRVKLWEGLQTLKEKLGDKF